jgi:hypothetical protein
VTFICGSHGAGLPEGLPDAGEGACCYGAAEYGPDGCTCWTPVYDLEQAAPVPQDRGLRTEMCRDCAYRPGSPERQGEKGHAADEEELMGLVASGAVFTCHQGIRRPVQWRHPSGATVPGHPADYRPPVIDGVAFRADGTPADICAGWAALRLKAVSRQR